MVALLDGLTEGLLLLDDAGQIRLCNGSAADLLRLTSTPANGTHRESLMQHFAEAFLEPEEVRAAWLAALPRREQRPCFVAELHGPPRRMVEIQLFPVHSPGTPPEWLGVRLRDVTAQQELLRLRDEVVATVSHELRGPLANLVGFTELMLTRPFSEADRHEFLDLMLTEAKRLARFINDLLDAQRLEQGAYRLTPTPTDLGRLLTFACRIVQNDRLHPVELDLPESLPLVQADVDRVQQVIGNLISNAQKYSPGGGKIRVEVRACTEMVEVAVSDQGLGIPPDLLNRVFDQFYRVETSAHGAIKGSGLGLSITRGIVEAHGGRIWAESKGDGAGSRFTFTLPVARMIPPPA